MNTIPNMDSIPFPTVICVDAEGKPTSLQAFSGGLWHGHTLVPAENLTYTFTTNVPQKDAAQLEFPFVQTIAP